MTAHDKPLDELYALIEKIENAMLTTRRPDGRLVSRPMATQKRDPIADLWFVTDIESHKLDELERDPQINLGYFDTRTREWVSVSGTAGISTDREAIRQRFQPDWKMWLGVSGPDDPRLALILVHVHSVTYMKRGQTKPMVLFELDRGMVPGKRRIAA